MSNIDGISGAVLRTPGGTYFIPGEDLESYRLPDDLADALKTGVLGSEGTGLRSIPDDFQGTTQVEFTPMTWNRTIRPDIQRIMLHTATRF
jgi:hypothetical protein